MAIEFSDAEAAGDDLAVGDEDAGERFDGLTCSHRGFVANWSAQFKFEEVVDEPPDVVEYAPEDKTERSNPLVLEARVGRNFSIISEWASGNARGDSTAHGDAKI